MPSLAVHFQRPGLWPLALLAAAVLIVVWWTYRRTYPPVGGGWRLLLAGLRSAAVVLVGLLLLEPLAVLSRDISRPERVALLVDRSAGMLLPSGDGASRLDEARALAAGADTLAGTGLFAFGRGLTPLDDPSALADSLVEDRTDLAGALKQLLELPGPGWDRVVVAGDGAVNAGGDPRAALPDTGLPVDVVAIGAAPDAFDLALSGINQPSPAYAGEQVELELTVDYAPAPGGQSPPSNVVCDILIDGRKVAERRLRVPAGGPGQLAATVEFAAPEAGRWWLEAELRPADGEWTALNNSRLYRLHVRPTRRTFLLVSNAPDWDLTYLGRALAANEDWRVETVLVLEGEGGARRVRRRGPDGDFAAGVLPGPAELDEAGLVLLHGAIHRFPRDFIGLVGRSVSEGGLSLVAWPAGELNPRGLPSGLAAVLPLDPGAGAISPVDAPDSPARVYTTDRYGVLDGLGGAGTIDDLPPVTSVYRGIELRRDAEILARSGSRGPMAGEGEPILAVRPAEGTRSAVVLAQGLWRWHMQRQADGPEAASFYRRLWEELAEWLVSAERREPLSLRPEREVLPRGAVVRLDGALDYADPADSLFADVRVALTRTDTAGVVDTLAVRKASAVSADGGEFSIDFGPRPPGRYSFSAVAVAGGDTLTASGELAVEGFSPEFVLRDPDSASLARLAEATGGRVVAPGEAGRAIAPADPVEVSVSSALGLSRTAWIYWLVVALLAAEWALRRTRALP